MVILDFAKFINAQFDFQEDEFGTCKNQIDNSMIRNVVTRLNFVVQGILYKRDHFKQNDKKYNGLIC